jgi:hypothetical protein
MTSSSMSMLVRPMHTTIHLHVYRGVEGVKPLNLATSDPRQDHRPRWEGICSFGGPPSKVKRRTRANACGQGTPAKAHRRLGPRPAMTAQLAITAVRFSVAYPHPAASWCFTQRSRIAVVREILPGGCWRPLGCRHRRSCSPVGDNTQSASSPTVDSAFAFHCEAADIAARHHSPAVDGPCTGHVASARQRRLRHVRAGSDDSRTS